MYVFLFYTHLSSCRFSCCFLYIISSLFLLFLLCIFLGHRWILNTVESFVSNNSATKSRVETLVNNVLDFLCTSRSTPKSFLSKHPGDDDPDVTKNEQNKHKNVSAHFFLFLTHLYLCFFFPNCVFVFVVVCVISVYVTYTLLYLQHRM
jgi:hypothetical protein